MGQCNTRGGQRSAEEDRSYQGYQGWRNRSYLAARQSEDVQTEAYLADGKVPGIEFDIPEDAYGAAILALVKDRGIIAEGRDTPLTWVRLFFPLTLLAINLVLQSVLVAYIFTHVTQPAVGDVQGQYRRFHAECFDESGAFLQAVWETWDGKGALCNVALTKSTFVDAILFIWMIRMIAEVRAATRFFTDVHAMPPCHTCSDMMHPESNHIVALTPLTRCLLFSLVCLPKLAISVALAGFGCRWLSATQNFQDLVLNTVSMEFVTKIDDTLFDACMPVAYKEEVQSVNFFIATEPQAEDVHEFRSFLSSVGYFIFAGISVVLYSHSFETVLPHSLEDITMHCKDYAETQQPFCNRLAFIDGCFPFGHANRTLFGRLLT